MEDERTAILYDYWRSTASYRVRIALHLCAVPFDSVPVDLTLGQQGEQAHLARNPQGFVPVLDIDGLRLTQSLAIIEYLNETRAGALLPADPGERARVRMLAHAIAMDIHPVCNLSVVQRVTQLTGQSEPTRTQWMDHFIRRGLEAFEALLGERRDGPYCAGAQPGLADLCLIPQLYNADRWKVDTSELTRINAVASACADHPAFLAARPRAPGA